MEGIKSRSNGSTFMEISKKAFRPIPALVPPPDIVKAFTSMASALFARLVETRGKRKHLPPSVTPCCRALFPASFGCWKLMPLSNPLPYEPDHEQCLLTVFWRN